MPKTFEDEFMEAQADMVSICLEYVEDDAEKIYIYASCENRATACNCFFKIDGKLWKKHLLNQISGKGYDVSIDIQRQCSQIILDDIDKVHLREIQSAYANAV